MLLIIPFVSSLPTSDITLDSVIYFQLNISRSAGFDNSTMFLPALAMIDVPSEYI